MRIGVLKGGNMFIVIQLQATERGRKISKKMIYRNGGQGRRSFWSPDGLANRLVTLLSTDTIISIGNKADEGVHVESIYYHFTLC